jgi:dolichol kinase
MKWEVKKEIVRKIPHMLSILLLVLYVFVGQFSHRFALFLFTLILVIILLIEFFRLDGKKKSKFFQYFSRFRRPKEKDHVGGEVFYMLGAIIALAVFDFRVAITAIAMTIFGDIAAALIGKPFGKHKIFGGKKSWEGTLAGFAVNFLIGCLFLRDTIGNALWFMYGVHPFGQPLWPVIIVMAVTASLIEVVVEKMDDNLMVPVFSGFAGQIVLVILSVQVIPFS